MSAASSQKALFDVEPYLRATQKYVFWLGLVLTCVSVYMTWNFGYAWSGFDWAFALSCLSLLACGLPIFIIMAYIRDWKPLAYALTGAWAIAFVTDAATQVGYSAATRDAETNAVQLTNTRWENRADSVEQHKKNRAIYLNQKETLLKLQPWAATVSADQLREALKQLDENIIDEGNAGGCGPKCRALKVQRQQLVQKIGAAESLVNINKQLKAVEVLISKSKQVLDKTDRKISFGDAQIHQIASVAGGFDLNPSDQWKQRVELFLKTAIGIALTFFAAVANALGLINWQQIDRKREQEREKLPAHESHPIDWEKGQKDLPSFLKEGSSPGPSVIRFDLFSKHFDDLMARNS